MTDTSTDDEQRMTLVEHLTELRRRLIISFVSIAVGVVVCWIAYDQILDFLLDPYCRSLPEGDRVATGVFGDGCNLFVTNPLEPFSVRLTVAGYGGLILAMPVVFWQLWRFVTPGLYAHEKRLAIPWWSAGAPCSSSAPAWRTGRCRGRFEFLSGHHPERRLIEYLYSPEKYSMFVVNMMVAFGVGFEFPIILVCPPDARRHRRATAPTVRPYAGRQASWSRRGHHPERRPDQPAGPGAPDVSLLRGRHPLRAASQPTARKATATGS